MIATKGNGFMELALIQANLAYKIGEVPVGAVVVCDGQVVSVAHNMRISDSDPTAHAEIQAMRLAGKVLGRWNLSGCDLWVTLEPCVMCAGAIVNARIDNVYFGAYDSRFGGLGSVYNIGSGLNHTFKIAGGIMQDECKALLSNFFEQIRFKNKQLK